MPGHAKVQSDAIFRAAADQAPQVMWIVNSKGAVTYLNRAWYDLVGGEPPKWYGHEWADAVHPDDVQQMRERWKTASATQGIFEGHRRVRSRQGNWHTLSYRAVPVFEGAAIVCWVGMDADVTEMFATQAALRFANSELEAFASAVSHDLRAPLVTVRGFSHHLTALLDASADAKAIHYADRIEAAVAHMGLLVDGLLALSQVSRQSLHREIVDISAMAADIADRLVRDDPQRLAGIDVQAGLSAYADRRLMAVLLENLLGNAWKFTSKTARAQISVGLQAKTPNDSTFYVRDNGAGFDPSHAAKLFSTFERLHTADEFPGTGVGLATVRRIVDRHGGRTWADSQPGVGSCFYFSLPESARLRAAEPSPAATP